MVFGQIDVTDSRPELRGRADSPNAIKLVAYQIVAKKIARWLPILYLVLFICGIHLTGWAGSFVSSAKTLQDYDIPAVCQFTAELLYHPENYIPASDWQAIKRGSFMKSTELHIPELTTDKIYTYSRGGVAIEYTKAEDIAIWEIQLEGNALPNVMQSREYFSNLFKTIRVSAENKFYASCDANELLLQFNGKKTASVKAQLLMGAI